MRDTETMRAQLKRNATLRLKGRLLLALSKNIAPDTRTAMVRWWVRTHKKYAKKCMTVFAVKSKVSVQVAFWRFKRMAAPFKKKRKHYEGFMQKVMSLMEIMEHRQKARLHRTAFYRIKLRGEIQRIVKDLSSLQNLGGIIESNTVANYTSLKSDTNLLANKDIFKRMISGVMGKYLDCLQKLRANRLQSLMSEKLSNQTLQRLIERLVSAAEGNLKGLTSQGYILLRKNKILFDKKKAICRRVIDVNFRLQSSGWNKLMDLTKEHLRRVKDKVRFIVKALQNQEARFLWAAYKGLVERKRMLEGVGVGDSDMKKIQLIKRLTNQGYNLQVMACNGLQEFLASERRRESAEQAEHARLQKEKDRILRRIMDANCRMQGQGFRQSFQWMEVEREKERL